MITDMIINTSMYFVLGSITALGSLIRSSLSNFCFTWVSCIKFIYFIYFIQVITCMYMYILHRLCHVLIWAVYYDLLGPQHI